MLLVLQRTAVLLAFAIPAIAGDIDGHVLITKKLTKKTVVPTVYNLRGTPTPTAVADTQPVNEFARTVIVLDGGKNWKPAAPQTVVIAQHDSRFEPDLVVIPVGSSVQFPNQDPIFHNVFSLSKAESFDLGFYPKSQSRTVKFDHAGVVQVYCHIHANMYAAIVVTDSPFYGRPAADGSFSWSNVPAGHYRVTAWHKIAGLYHAEVDVPASGRAQVTIQVPVDTERRQ